MWRAACFPPLQKLFEFLMVEKGFVYSLNINILEYIKLIITTKGDSSTGMSLANGMEWSGVGLILFWLLFIFS